MIEQQNLRTEAAANQLVAARLARRPGARLAESCRPRDNEAALAIQRRVGELLHFDVGGWKCSLPTTDKAAFMAPIYAPTITSASPCSVLSEGANARVEPEIAFVVGRDLKRRGQPYSDADVRSAIRETRLVLELIGCRYADPTSVSFLEMLADGLNNQGLFVGPEVSDGLILAMREQYFPITKMIWQLMGRIDPGAPGVACALGVVGMLLLSASLLVAGKILGQKMGQMFRV